MNEINSKLHYKAEGDAIWGVKVATIAGVLFGFHVLFSDPSDPYIWQTSLVFFIGSGFCLTLFLLYNVKFFLDLEKINWERNFYVIQCKKTIRFDEIEKIEGPDFSYNLILTLKGNRRFKILSYARLQGAPDKIEGDGLKRMKNEMEYLKSVIESRMKSP